MKVVIAGEQPLLEEVGQVCQAAGHEITLYPVEDFYDAVQSGHSMREAVNADVVIELHNESAAAKQELLLSLSSIVRPGVLFLTSALAVSATQAAAWCKNPGRVIGLGMAPPLGESPLVELAAALQSDERTMEEAVAFWQDAGCEAVVVADGPGLVRMRTICCLINEAISALQEGIADAEDIDRAMKLGANYPHGPLEWADYIGLDTVLGVMNGLYNEWGEDRYRPAPLLRRMVAAGHLGLKSGRGFYVY